MARIPEEEIERIKRGTDLAALVRSRGVVLDRHGAKDLIGICPFHEDHNTPNLIVSPHKGLFHCMACGAAGNPIQFVEKFDGVSFRHAFELLAEGRGFAATSTSPKKEGTARRLEVPFDPDASDAELMRQVVEFYRERLLATPAALDYLASRGLYNDEAIERFRIGFADRTLGLRLPEKNRKEGAAIRERLQKLGILRESGHEHFNGSVVLPIFGAGGEAVEVYGRKITPKLRKGTPLHLYLPGPHEGIWNAEALDPSTSSGQANGELILCEAPLDALTFWVNGFRNVSFIFGTEGFPDYLFDAILAKKVRRVRIAYDADEAGNRAAARDAERFTAHGIEVFRVKFPHGMDANEYAQKVRPARKALETALNAAEWLGLFVRGTQTGGAVAAPPPSRAGASSSESLAATPLAAELAAKEESDIRVHPSPFVVPTFHREGDYHTLALGQRRYRVGGLDKNNSLDAMKITLRLAVYPQPGTKNEEPGTADEVRFHLDSFDLLRDGERRRFIERAAEETGLEKELIKRDLGKLLLALEEAQQARLSAILNPEPRTLTPELSGAEREEAMALLKAPDLIDRIVKTFSACGMVGEVNNLLGAYLACTSRKLEKPLAAIVQSTSAAGKSTLMEAVLAMFPEEERIKYSAMTGQSLYYLGETNLKHKILAIVEEEGAEKASYALKLLQSEGELTIASTGKDPHTGRMVTQEYRVEGPVMIFLTTTAIEIDEELLNRCMVLTIDESREQTERIHELQRKSRTLEGLRMKKERRRSLTLLRNAQRLLDPIDVMNPWADRLTFTTQRTRTRRDHEKYLTLIDAIALLHQRQREREKDADGGDFIRVTLDDVALANRLAPEILGRSLDELPPQTRRLLDHIKAHVRDLCEREQLDRPLALFSRRRLCESIGWTYSQVKRHLVRLQELEYVAARFARVGSTLHYELLVDRNESESANPIGLLDVAQLTATTPPRTG